MLTQMLMMPSYGNASRTANILEHKTPRCSTVSNTPLSSNSFAARTVKFGNDQIAPILGYGDLVQGTITIKRVYYVKGLNNLFSVGQFCDADLEVAFRKSTCEMQESDKKQGKKDRNYPNNIPLKNKVKFHNILSFASVTNGIARPTVDTSSTNANIQALVLDDQGLINVEDPFMVLFVKLKDVNSMSNWKRISDKRTKNKAKNDKTKH
ncbi:hypothetical protein Tco_1053751 [Tanacetum coccineum]|uniref:Integrase, catalytic region, zinc finger, CCHC-type, peptidase aspartic, catalytic n=1 Tax=Tanacetum coccineum TaxID=301880 RepID=A0ABQ5GVU5_9ASTR